MPAESSSKNTDYRAIKRPGKSNQQSRSTSVPNQPLLLTLGFCQVLYMLVLRLPLHLIQLRTKLTALLRVIKPFL
jgi:hypothetical protein